MYAIIYWRSNVCAYVCVCATAMLLAPFNKAARQQIHSFWQIAKSAVAHKYISQQKIYNIYLNSYTHAH